MARRPSSGGGRAWLRRSERPRLVTPGNHDAPYLAWAERFFTPFRRYEASIGPARGQTYRGRGLAVHGINTARGVQPRLNWSKGQISPATGRRGARGLVRTVPAGTVRGSWSATTPHRDDRRADDRAGLGRAAGAAGFGGGAGRPGAVRAHPRALQLALSLRRPAHLRGGRRHPVVPRAGRAGRVQHGRNRKGGDPRRRPRVERLPFRAAADLVPGPAARSIVPRGWRGSRTENRFPRLPP